MEKRFPGIQLCAGGKRQLYRLLCQAQARSVFPMRILDRSGRPSESKMLTGKVGEQLFGGVSDHNRIHTVRLLRDRNLRDTSAGKTVYYYENTYSRFRMTQTAAAERRQRRPKSILRIRRFPKSRLPVPAIPSKGGVPSGTEVWSMRGRCTERKRQSDSRMRSGTKRPIRFPFDANGGTGAPGSINKRYSAPATIPFAEPTRSGYVFRGWSPYSTALSAMYLPGDYYRSNVSRTLYAVWEKIPETYTVSYSANGGTGAPATQTKTENIDLTLSSVIPTRKGYTFLGGAKTVPDRRIISREQTIR